MPAKKAAAALKDSRRDWGFDNIRALLIFLVVFCHLCEPFCDEDKPSAYQVIYSFHIPCFLFVSGYFARFDAKKVAKHILLPYAVFQVLYTWFNCTVVNPSKEFALQFTYPYWIMWYLLSLFFFYLLIPLLETKSRWAAGAILLLLTALSLHIGTDSLAGYTVSLSRTLVFLPCFFFGYYAGTTFAPGFVAGLRRWRWVLAPILLAGVVIYCVSLLRIGVTSKLLYGSYSYEKAGATPWLRLLVLAGAMAWMLLLVVLIPTRRIPVWTVIGQRTMPIFLLHGFVQRLLITEGVFRYTRTENYLLALGLTCAILLVFSSKPVHKLFRWLF